jgi:hypothetical protein
MAKEGAGRRQKAGGRATAPEAISSALASKGSSALAT